MRKIENNTTLLKQLVENSNIVSTLWRPANYWRPYCNRIVDEVTKNGLKNFRTNQRILKGFSAGGIKKPIKPRAKWKKIIWDIVENFPLVNTIISQYQRIINSYYKEKLDADIIIAKLALNEIQKKFPELVIPDETINGGADDTFDWKGKKISADWILYLSRIADFYQKVDPSEVKTILEIGPGLGMTTIAHLALNPNIKTIINVDIVPIIYISGQFLKTVNGINIIDYSHTKDEEKINISSNSDTVNIFSLPPSELEKISIDVDYFFNAFSFMEMEPDICQNYAHIINNITKKGVYLHSEISGHKKGAGNQKDTVDFEFIKNLFSQDFPNKTRIDGIWNKYYNGNVDKVILMQK